MAGPIDRGGNRLKLTANARTALALVLALSTLGLAACGGSSDSPTGDSGGTLQITDLVVGTGATAATGDTATVHYVGTFTTGVKFDSSYDRGQPFTFRIGAGNVIRGWDEGIPGMKVGGKRRLVIPPSLAYGSQGQGPIPPNATLVFEVALLSLAGK
jgi:peptidylprolyl isomerase